LSPADSRRSESVAGGFAYTECPRWHQGRLWFSDQYLGRVYAMTEDGEVEAVAEVPGRPAGLGWLPDGRLLVVSMDRHQLLLLDGVELRPVADLAPYHAGPSNDMAVDRLGRAYIGNIGFDYYGGEDPKPTQIVLADPSTGQCSVAADELSVPNGTVITPDGRRLILAESFGHRLTAFDIGDDGNLYNRKVFADLGSLVPDGICLDAEGAIWAATIADGAVRVRESGDITDRVGVPGRHVYACVLGGPGGRDLYMCSAGSDEPSVAVDRKDATIERITVDIPAAEPPDSGLSPT
jgi:sugar lactone lactonase YvrE